MAINPQLKLAIFESGDPQVVIAKRAGVDETRLSRIIRGHVEATASERKALARALRLPVDDLFPTEALAS